MLALSDDEDGSKSVFSSDDEAKVVEEVIVKKGKGRAAEKQKVDSPPEADAGEVEGDDEEEEEEDVFVVEKIIDHKVDAQGNLKFHIKWQGYPKLSDHTWEPEENLEAASEVLEEYISSIGGRDMLATARKTPKKRGRQSTTNSSPSQSQNGRKVRKVESEVDEPPKLPPGNWEDLIEHIDTMEKSVDGVLHVLLTFKTGQRVKQPVSTVYLRCPQKMLRFYENHLSIIPATRSTEESTNVEL